MKTNYLILSMILLFAFSFSMVSCEKDDDKNGNGQQQKTITVPDDYLTIQAAIDASQNGDLIIVKPGIYKENINFNGKEVTVRSTDPEDNDIVVTTIIDGDEKGRVVRFENGEGAGTVLQGFTIINGTAGTNNGGGVFVTNSSCPVIKNCIFYNNKAAYGAAITVTQESCIVVDECLFKENIATSRRGAAIYVINKSSAEILNSVFIDHEGGDGVIHIGSTYTDESSAIIKGNTINNNTTDFGVGGIKVTAVSSAEISNNIITNNTGRGDNAAGAIYVGFESTATITNNTISGNKGRAVGAIVIHRESVATISGNTITENTAGSQDESYGLGGGIILTYFGEATITNNIISENIAWSANHGGGGIAIYSWGQETYATISNNQITNNKAFRRGGGIYVAGSATDVIINNNTIDGNRSEGHNTAKGAGIYIGTATSKIYGNVISNGWAGWRGGGIYFHRDATVKDEANQEWTKMNYPPQNEPNNTYADNEHIDDYYQGVNVFFAD